MQITAESSVATGALRKLIRMALTTFSFPRT